MGGGEPLAEMALQVVIQVSPGMPAEDLSSTRIRLVGPMVIEAIEQNRPCTHEVS